MARQWVVSGRAYPEYDEFGAIVSTTVSLASQNDGYATFTETLSGDHTRKTNDELITLAKNQYFKKEYADYAMQDAVIKVDELERSIKKSEVLQASLQTLINETKLQSSKNAEDLIAAENSRNAVFENIVTTINGYEQRLTNLIATTNSFMEEVFTIIDAIYGTDNTVPYLPTPEQVIQLTTVNDSPEPANPSTPVDVPGYRPTSVLTIDSKKATPAKWKAMLTPKEVPDDVTTEGSTPE